jgi:hypothetical protein
LHYPRLANLHNILLVCLLSIFSEFHAQFEGNSNSNNKVVVKQEAGL